MAEKSPGQLSAEEQRKLDETLYWAAKRGLVEDVQSALSSGASINSWPVWHQTPLYTAAFNNHEMIVELLLRNNADPNIHNGRSPLYVASREGHQKIVELLLKYNANPNLSDNDGRSPLFWASMKGHQNIAELLLKYKANPNLSNKTGVSPLHMAGTVEMYQLLVSYGASQEAVTERGSTVSHAVCIRDRVDVLDYLLRECLFTDDALNKNNETPIDVARGKCRELLKAKGFIVGPIKAETLKKVYHGVKQTSGKMKVARVLMHGPPRVGKTSVKRLVLGKSPEKQDSTGLVEDPVRAISTIQMMSLKETSLEEIDEQKMISLIQCEVQEAAIVGSEKTDHPLEFEPSTNTAATDTRRTQSPNIFVKLFRKLVSISQQADTSLQSTSSGTSNAQISATTLKENNLPGSKILSKIAADLDSINSDSPSLFNCKHVHLIDSGGQPQFSNLLPLVFQSQSHHHMVVIRLDQKLHDKPRNCYEINGIKYEFPECLLLTNYQLIERVCQLAAGSNSVVIVIGTHLDQENKKEPLAKKNEMLAPLMQKYRFNLAHTENHEPIFAVNAMVAEEAERTEYAKSLRKVMLGAPVLAEAGSSECTNEEGIAVPLRWIILELELSRRAKNIGILDKSEIDEVAQLLEVADLDQALAFFKKLAVHYHYPEVLPNKIFTSIAPISSRLSKIVEATFPHDEATFRRDPDQERLQETGELTREFLKKITPMLKAIDDQFSVEDFISLMKHLRMIFEMDDGAFLFPSLLPLEAESPTAHDKYHQESLFLFWLNEHDKIRILPQSFFHALVVELLRRKEVKLNRKCKHTRTSFTFNFAFEGGDKSEIVLADHVFWMEVKTDVYTNKPEECKSIKAIIQFSTKCVLEQLKLTSLGDLVCGMKCYSKDCKMSDSHPSQCVRCAQHIFSCVLSASCKWQETNQERLFWFKDNDAPDDFESDSVRTYLHSSSAVPTASEVFDILKERSAEWDSFGRELQIPLNYRKSLRTTTQYDEDCFHKLECIIDRWMESKSSPVSWETLKDVLLKLKMSDLVLKVNEHLTQ